MDRCSSRALYRLGFLQESHIDISDTLPPSPIKLYVFELVMLLTTNMSQNQGRRMSWGQLRGQYCFIA
jgi:hypothetical protein